MWQTTPVTGHSSRDRIRHWPVTHLLTQNASDRPLISWQNTPLTGHSSSNPTCQWPVTHLMTEDASDWSIISWQITSLTGHSSCIISDVSLTYFFLVCFNFDCSRLVPMFEQTYQLADNVIYWGRFAPRNKRVKHNTGLTGHWRRL